MIDDALLTVDNLHTEFPGRGPGNRTVRAVDGVSLSVRRGEIIGVVGESGCGKTMLALSVLRLVHEPGKIVAGRILFEGRDLLSMDEEEIRRVRGAGVAMTFQDPMTSLNPLTRVGSQIREAMTAHDRFTSEVADDRVVPLLRSVRIPGADRRQRDYPHQFSGGMRQRIVVAMGMSNEPSLLIADEPTTALDVTTQAQVVRLLIDVNASLGTAILLITHNMALLAGLCQRVVVMYAGRIVEEGPVEQIFNRPQHPYTWALLRAVPSVDAPARGRMLSIPGVPPDLAQLPGGCTFHARCPFREERCAIEEPPLVQVGSGGRARCWVLMANVAIPTAELASVPEISLSAAQRLKAVLPGVDPAEPAAGDNDTLLRVEEVVKHFPATERGRGPVRAVDGVSFDLRRGETLALIGESGCGKTTLARVIARLLAATSGRVLFEGRDLTALRGRGLRGVRSRMQIVFQDPFSSLDPRMTVGDIIAEPLSNFGLGGRHEQWNRVGE
ncbi:MAG: ABC transporter ATP-binding protein, partial [Actinomycetota bacterium]|nr:ABC transporter ATP-binding protein [Actinomycetota bacterium]